MKGIKIDKDVRIIDLVKKTNGYSGSDISNVCREAAMMPMRRKLLERSIDISEFAKMN
jgi:SpoVK/Ycf46/Vps4 family AAA+-type ATPase